MSETLIGYCNITIESKDTVSALEAALGYLNGNKDLDPTMKDYLSKDQGMMTLEGLLREIGFSINKGTIQEQLAGFRMSDDNLDSLFTALAPFIKDGSRANFIHEGTMWCWVFKGGKMYQDDLEAVPSKALKAMEFAGINMWEVITEE